MTKGTTIAAGLLLLSAAATTLAADGSAADRHLDLAMEPRALLEMMQPSGAGSLAFGLPQLWAFDAEGRPVFHGRGYSSRFGEQLEAALEAGGRVESGPTLASLLPAFRDRDGAPVSLEGLSPTRFTVVEYWAEWCKPCELQRAAVEALIERRPDLSIRFLEVEADPMKVDFEALAAP